MNKFYRFFYRLKGLFRPVYPNVDKSATVHPSVLVYNHNNLIMEENADIPRGAVIMNVYAKFIMKKHAFSSINLTVITGNHPQFPGRFSNTISKKKEHLDVSLYDKDVIVNEDVWIGCNVTLLAGVNIGRCSVVAAGSVVTKSMPPYCIIGGVPAKPIKVKWTMDDILFHENTLFPEEVRYSREFLLEEFSKYNLKVE